MIIKSEKLVYDKTAKKYTAPVWQLDTAACTVTHTDEATLKVERQTFHTDYIKDHLRYVASKNPDRLRRYVNEGTILEYLDELEGRAVDAVESQVEKWAENDKEYQLAVMNGDTMKQVGLLNNLKYRARELIYDAIIYA